jgi:hypothetical protein
MGPQLPAAGSHGQDELACQRQKHWAASLRRSVPGFGAITVGQLVAVVRAATAKAGGTLDVTGFLARQGHSQETIETVRSYLGLERRAELRGHGASHAAFDGVWSRRLRALEQLQTLLLEE